MQKLLFFSAGGIDSSLYGSERKQHVEIHMKGLLYGDNKSSHAFEIKMRTRCYINVEDEGYKVENHTHYMTILESNLHQELCILLSIHPNNLVLSSLKMIRPFKLKFAGSFTADI